MIRKLERDEILEELVKFYIKKNNEAKNENNGFRCGLEQLALQLVMHLDGQHKELKQSKLMMKMLEFGLERIEQLVKEIM